MSIIASTGTLNDSSLERLLRMGFKHAGCWNCESKRLALPLEAELARASNVLYAFVMGGRLMYLGKSKRSLRERMNGYRNPHATQSTNVRNNRQMLDAIAGGQVIEVYVLPDNGLLYYGGFHVNLAAGLEDSLIRELKPPWNGVRDHTPLTRPI